MIDERLSRFFTSVRAMAGVVALLSLGCSSADAPSAGGATPAAAPAVREACAIITAEEATAILKSAVAATPRATSAARSTCDYVPAGGPDGQAFQSFTLEAIWSGAEAEIASARSAASAATSAAGGSQDSVVASVMGLQRVDGLGDEAYFSRRGMSYVRKGDVLLVFQNAGLNDPARERWEALARAALARL